MKVVLATPLYPPESGGPATYAALLEEVLPPSGISVATVKFSDVRHLPKLVRHVAYSLRVYAAARRANLVYALDPVSTGLPALCAAKLAGKPFVLKMVGDYAWEQGVQRYGVTDLLDEFVTRTEYPMQVKFLRGLERFVARRARVVIVPSEYLKRIVIAWGIQEKRVRVVYNAAPSVSVATGTVPDHGSYVVTVGRLVPWKGVAGVIDAVSRIPNLSLVVIGDGPEKEELARRSSDKIRFLGALPHSETLAYLKHADALILNTKYEGLSHLLLEACALGTPIITTPVGGNPEIVTDGETGLMVTPDDTDAMGAAITKIRSDAGLRGRMTRAAREKAASFSKERLVQETVTLLQSLV
ncbi:MAG: glycogen(starch) synthase [Parcubacteria bacterium C7867-001]|nr:MAG: glycogen(starch) synthase [Parcubacteria bacterium C7867-001]